MIKRFPIHPANPERICWGCDRYCAADAMACGAERTPHLVELFGPDWADWSPGRPPGAPAVDEVGRADRDAPADRSPRPAATP